MLMRKASAFRISWSYHLYRASLRESTGSLVQSPQLYIRFEENYQTGSPATVENHGNLGSPGDHHRPKALIVRPDCSQDLSTLSSIFGSKGPLATGVFGSSQWTCGSSDGFLQRTMQSLLRQSWCRTAIHEGAHERAPFTICHHASVQDDSKAIISPEWSNPSIVTKSSCGDCGLETKGHNSWASPEMRKVQDFLATFKTEEYCESSQPLQSRRRNPMSEAVKWNSKLVPLGLGLSYSSGRPGTSGSFSQRGMVSSASSVLNFRSYISGVAPPTKSETIAEPLAREYSQRAVVTALWCNFLVFSLKLGVWVMTSSHVMLAEAIHSFADLANQGLLAYGLMSSKRAPDAMHPYGYTKERFVWSLISAVGIFCLGSGATIINGVQNLFSAQPMENVYLAALVIGGSVIMEGASLLVAISCVRNGAKAEGMTMRDYLWRGHDPTSVAVMMEDGAAVTGLGIAAIALAAAHYTGNPMWDPIGSIVVGNLLGVVAIFLIQRNRHALLGRSMDDKDMMRVITLLSKDPVVDAIYDCKSEVIGPGAYRFKAEIDFNGVVIVQNYLKRAGRGNWHKEFTEAVSRPEPGHLDRVLAAYGEEVVSALGSEVDRLEKEIQKIVPGIRHVDIEAHNPQGPAPREKLYIY